jgi:Uma2 family endonuclease
MHKTMHKKHIPLRMSQAAVNYISQEEYLAFEREALDKHEYYNGEIFAMSGASFKHNLIETNLRGALYNFLKDSNCNQFGSNLRVHIPANSLYTYPDILVLCDAPVFTDEVFDTITNPSIIVEILSPSTANYDRGVKFYLYRENPSLNEYLLIDSQSIHVIVYTKNADNTWTLSETKNMEDTVSLSSIHFTTGIADIYRGIAEIKR